MAKYNVSFIRNGICQSNLAEADSREAVEEWFAQNKPDARVLTVREVATDDLRPGKPTIVIGQEH